jgi:hypothetical protein
MPRQLSPRADAECAQMLDGRPRHVAPLRVYTEDSISRSRNARSRSSTNGPVVGHVRSRSHAGSHYLREQNAKLGHVSQRTATSLKAGVSVGRRRDAFYGRPAGACAAAQGALPQASKQQSCDSIAASGGRLRFKCPTLVSGNNSCCCRSVLSRLAALGQAQAAGLAQ